MLAQQPSGIGVALHLKEEIVPGHECNFWLQIFGEADEDDPFAAKKKEKKDTEVTKLYGDWQTEEWILPKAENGRVPKNEHGNVLCPPLAFALPRVGGSHLVQSVLADINVIIASARSSVCPNTIEPSQ